ncbi:MAG: imelysin family protein [Pseudomonadota bacterium]
MRHLIAALAFAGALGAAKADEQTIAAVVDDHIIPAFAELDAAADDLATEARKDCAPTSEPLRVAYQSAYDAWLGAAHLQIGPLEEAEFAFALSFWPDPRGKTAKALRRLIAAKDPIAGSGDYSKVSVAARGFLALERMLYDDTITGDAGYKCTLLRAISDDIAATADKLHQGWLDTHAASFKSAGAPGNEVFPATEDAIRKFYTALMTSLGFDAEARIGRPLGTVQKPRPRRAEARRSGRPLRNLRLSIAAQRAFAAALTPAGQDDTAPQVDAAFRRVLDQIAEVDNPLLDGTASSTAWLKIDIIKQDIVAIQVTVDGTLGRDLGLFVGFNSRDGD